MSRPQALVIVAVVALWLTLHVARAVAALGFGVIWDVDPAVNLAMGSVISLVLGGPALYRLLKRNGMNGADGAKEKSNGAD